MAIEWSGDLFLDSQVFARAAFEKLSDPDEDMISALLFWRDAKLTHVEGLDSGHFASDRTKSELWEKIVPGLIRERRPDTVSHLVHVRTTQASGQLSEGVIVSVIGLSFVRMSRAEVTRRQDGPPVLGEWAPYPASPDLTVKSWTNEAVQRALARINTGSAIGRFFRGTREH